VRELGEFGVLGMLGQGEEEARCGFRCERKIQWGVGWGGRHGMEPRN
jgi:hypothetical protein